MAEWSARRTRNPAVLGSSPALPVGVFNPVMLYLNSLFLCELSEWIACKLAA